MDTELTNGTIKPRRTTTSDTIAPQSSYSSLLYPLVVRQICEIVRSQIGTGDWLSILMGR